MLRYFPNRHEHVPQVLISYCESQGLDIICKVAYTYMDLSLYSRYRGEKLDSPEHYADIIIAPEGTSGPEGTKWFTHLSSQSSEWGGYFICKDLAMKP